MKELMLHCDLTRDDTLFYFTTCGWMMWNWLVSALGVGATVVLYEGNPGYPDLNRLWEMSERLGITVFGTSAKYLSACEKAEAEPGKRNDLAKLRTVLSTGSPEGLPHGSVVWYVYEDGALWFNIAPDSKKARNLAGESRVALTIDAREWPYRAATVTGRVEQRPFDEAR